MGEDAQHVRRHRGGPPVAGGVGARQPAEGGPAGGAHPAGMQEAPLYAERYDEVYLLEGLARARAAEPTPASTWSPDSATAAAGPRSSASSTSPATDRQGRHRLLPRRLRQGGVHRAAHRLARTELGQERRGDHPRPGGAGPARRRLRLDELGLDWSQSPGPRPRSVVPPARSSCARTSGRRSTAVVAGMASGDRGKLIMACGTGKTFTSLQDRRGAGRRRRHACCSWCPRSRCCPRPCASGCREPRSPIRPFAVCSDVQGRAPQRPTRT